MLVKKTSRQSYMQIGATILNLEYPYPVSAAPLWGYGHLPSLFKTTTASLADP